MIEEMQELISETLIMEKQAPKLIGDPTRFGRFFLLEHLKDRR
jgi:hypothetical protein